jgi:hypothetical protein
MSRCCRELLSCWREGNSDSAASTRELYSGIRREGRNRQWETEQRRNKGIRKGINKRKNNNKIKEETEREWNEKR